MSKPLSKKGAERRKKARGGEAKRTRSSKSKAAESAVSAEACRSCAKDLASEERVLFVEEEVGRVFCSEECIGEYFSPEVARLEKEFFRYLAAGDLTPEEREGLAHLRWLTLQEPDEVWRQKTLTGDHRYTLIAEFEFANRPVWCVCVCLFLRGEPSFLFLAFPTRNAAMMEQYRRGEPVEWVRPESEGDAKASEAAVEAGEDAPEAVIDGLAADGWSNEETFRAELSQQRQNSDIPDKDFGLYEKCIEETLNSPDEVWRLAMNGEDSPALYHFIRRYDEEDEGYWYVVATRETEDPEQLEILDVFPTHDLHLVEQYRRGEQEMGDSAETRSVSSRVLH